MATTPTATRVPIRLSAPLVLLLLGLFARLPGVRAQEERVQGRPVLTHATRTENVLTMAQRDLLVARAAAFQGARIRRVATPFRPLPLPAGGDGGVAPDFRSNGFITPPGPEAPQAVGLDFLGVKIEDEPGVNGGGENIPPDTDGCVGPLHFVETVNGAVAIYLKSNGSRVSIVSLDSFFFINGSIPGSSHGAPKSADPHIIYDRRSGHWIATAIDTLLTDNNCILALSRTNDPTGLWDKYSFDAGTGGVFGDYDTLGIDDNGIYIGFNNFSGGGAFQGSKVWATPKAAALAAHGAAITITDLQPAGFTDMSTPQPAYNFDSIAASGPAWVIGTSFFTSHSFRKITWTGATPSITASLQFAGVTTFAQPVAPPVPNSVPSPDGGDIRLLAAVIRNGHLWTAHTIGVDSTGSSGSTDRDAAGWYEIDVSGAAPALVQQGRVFDNAASNPKSYFFPTICVSGQGHAAIAFSGSSANSFIGVYTCGRLASDAAGTMRAVTQVKAGEGDYVITFGGGKNRWGDYSYTSLDPNDDMSLWSIQEYAGPGTGSVDPTGVWRTRIMKLLAPAPTLNNPGGSGNRGQSGVSVSLTGTGFYDPGAGFTRPTAVLSGTGISNYGLTVNSSTSATLTFDIDAGATAGARNLTFTNPDGQSVVVNNAFTVNAGQVFGFSATSYNVNEAAGVATLTVNRSGPTTGAATLHYHTTAVTATNGTDYTGTTDSTVVFASGDTSKPITVPIADDALLESDENFTVTLDSTSAGSIGGTTTAGVIIKDDLDTPKPTNLALSVSGVHSVLISFTDHCANETGFELQRALSGGSFSVINTLAAKIGTGGTVTFTDSTVASGNSYFYKVRAKNGALGSNFSANPGITVGPPTAPVLSSVTVLSCRQVKVVWQDKSTNELNFKVEAKTGGGSFTTLTTPLANAVNSSPGGLDPDTDYTFHVLAQNGAGTTTSNEVTAHTFALPNPPINVTASVFSPTAIRLFWTSGDAHSNFWRIERSTDGTSFSLLTQLDKSILHYTDSGLPTGSTRFYRISAISGTTLSNANLFGVGTPSGVVSATTLRKPNAPINLAATALSATQIRLTWQDGDTNTDEFRIERQSGASWLLVSDVGKTVLFFTVNSLPANQSFTFRVSAIAGTNLTSPQFYVVSDPAGPVTQSTLAAPAAPTNLTATAQAGAQILLAWSENATTETEYRVERSTDGMTFTEIAQLPKNTTGYRNTGLTAGVTYTYRVRALSGSLFSAYSNTRAATAVP